MRALGIDPGYDRLGVAIIEKIDGHETVLFSTCIVTDKKATIPDRLLAAGNELSTIIDTYQPTLIGIETIFFNKNVKTAIGVAEARGAVLYIAKRAGCAVCELSPQQVKIAVTGYGNSDKQAVWEMVKRLIRNVPHKALDDEYDAIAVGVAALAHTR
jgi:crossover junction endodeoxyribonuclease RuvC